MRTGETRPACRRGKLASCRDFLIAAVEKQPDITMPKLAIALEAERGVKASPSSLSRFLYRHDALMPDILFYSPDLQEK